MVQFEVVEAIYEADTPISKEDIVSKLDLHSSTVEAGVKDCMKKGYIRTTDQGLELEDGFNQDDLERIRPKTLEELRNR
jgi:predicted transcriptional regulator